MRLTMAADHFLTALAVSQAAVPNAEVCTLTKAARAHQRAADGRQFLREALEGPVSFTPDGKQYRFEATLGSVG
jgi:hypothetical protein